MSTTLKRVASLFLVICMLLSVALLAGCKKTPVDPENPDNTTTTPKTYTYKTYTTAFGTNWNPHSWETNADDSVNGYITSPFVTMSIKDSENGVYQWVYEMATSITDVTAANKNDLTKYGSTLPEGKTLDQIDSGFVFEIKLNPNAKWENGVAITADDYIYSMEQLLNSKMRNYRSNLYWSGESAVAGGLEFYNSEAPIYEAFAGAEGVDGNTVVYIDVNAAIISGYSIADLADMGYIANVKDDEGNVVAPGYTYYTELDEAANAYGYTEITAENKEKVLLVLDQYLGAFGESIYVMDFMEDPNGKYVWDATKEEYVPVEEGQTGTHKYDYVLVDGNKTVNEEYYSWFLFYNTGRFGDKVEYDKVGCYKVDDYTIRYVTETYIDYNYFLTSCTSTWLVYKDLYEAGKDTTGTLVTTNYGTSLETTMGYGPYKLLSYEEGKQMVFVQNENWYGYTKLEDGTLYSETNFLVDGKKVQQYQTQKIVIDLIEENATAKTMFLNGQLSDWSLEADDLVTYGTSDKMYKVDETYTMSFFFNTDVNALKEMDASKGNQYSVVLSNTNFRKAMSLAINRAEYVAETAGYKPAYSIMNNLYYYDVYNDPTSSYRQSDEAMQAICNLYGVQYGEGTPYDNLKEAYQSINGYNLTEAKQLMKTACEELVAAGLYTEGAPIKIRIAWAKGALQSSDNKQATVLQNQLNAAIEGSGFGQITLEAVGSIADRYGDVPKGEYAIGYGAWGGAAFYPFRNFQVYMDPDNTDINEAACWDPTTYEMTLVVNGEEVTYTAQQWANSMIGAGPYTDADFETKLSITAQLEEQYLKMYYRIPLAGTTICSMLSYQVKYYTEDYNIMYGFGGLRLMSYVYDDAAWAEYVASQGGTLSYE